MAGSFLGDLGNFFKKLGGGIASAAPVLTGAEPFIAATPAGPIYTAALGAITLVEMLIQGTGAQKKAAATAIVTATVPTIDQTQLSVLIDALVAALNAASKSVPAPTP